MKIFTKVATHSIAPFRIMRSQCRILSAGTKVAFLLATFSLLWIVVVSFMKVFISMDVKWLEVLQDKRHILDFHKKAIHLQRPYNTNVLGLPNDVDTLHLKPRELSKGRNQSRKGEPLNKETKEQDASNKKENRIQKNGASVNKNNVSNGYNVTGDNKDNKNKGYNSSDHEGNNEDQKKDGGKAIHKNQNEEKGDSLKSKQNQSTSVPHAKYTKVSTNNNVKGPQNHGKEAPWSTFIPNEPDTSPLLQAPDIPKRFLIEEADYCRKRSNLQIITYVHSSIPRVKERMDTRRSWGNASAYDMGPMNVSIGVVFMVGRAKNKVEKKIVQEESEKYHDIVQGSYGDHYRLLTYKGLAGLYWINKHCAHVPWTLHSDDDTHIDIFLYHRALQQLDAEAKQKFICSHMYGPALRYGRYKVRYEEYPAQDYPLYCSGGVWFLQTKLIKRLLLVQKTVPFLWVDDAYITGLLARRAGIGQYPFQQFYGGPHARPEKIGKEVAWFVKFASRTEWWQKIVEYHKTHSMRQPATLASLTTR